MTGWKQKLSQKTAAAAAASGMWLEKLARPGTRALPKDARTVLVLQQMLPLGSCVHMTPAFEAMRRGRPDLVIAVATRGLNLELLRHSPFVDHLLETPSALTDLPGAIHSLRSQLTERGLVPDGCLTGAADQRSRIALLAAAASSGWRGGFTIVPQSYHYPLVYDRTISLIANHLRLASLVGAPTGLLEPRVFYTRQNADTARALLEPVGEPDPRPILVAVTQNGGKQATGWHAERWVQVLNHAQDALGYRIVFVGTAEDIPAIEALRHLAGGIGHSLAGKTTVTTLAAVLAFSDMVVSLDTGTMHVGRAVRVPMVVLGPSWQKPLEWLPLSQAHVTILRGEDRVGIPPGYRLDEIAAQSVMDALDRLSRLYPPHPAARRARVDAGISTVDLRHAAPGTPEKSRHSDPH